MTLRSILIDYIICLFICYLLWIFINVDIDASSWSKESRASMILIATIAAIVSQIRHIED